MRIGSERHILSMSGAHPPVARVRSGDTVVFETLDCFSGAIKKESDLFSTVSWAGINPATGPVYVEGAAPGDVLRVKILDIKVASQGVSAVGPKMGVFGDRLEQEVTRVVPVRDGMVHFSPAATVSARPMIGVIGTAPPDGAEIPTGTPGAHGGNMDCKEIVKGVALYLPVNVDGALLAMGDLHAAMGDGEVSVCGIEIAGEVTVQVDVLKNPNLPLPFLVNDTHVMAIHSAETLDEAAEGATYAMHRFLTDKLGVEYHEAVMLLSTVGDLRICQVVDPLKTCRMELSLDIACRYGYTPD